MMRTPDGHSKLELTRYHAPAADGAGPENPPPNTLGLHRVMFAVNDIHDTVARPRVILTSPARLRQRQPPRARMTVRYRRTEPLTGDHLGDSPLPSSRLSTDHSSMARSRARPRCLTLSAAC